MTNLNSVCPHFGVCGGCSRQNQPYEKQLAEKEAWVKKELAEWPVRQWNSITPSPDLIYYRNKMEYSFGDLMDLHILRNRDKTPLSGPNAIHLGLHPKKRFSLVTPTPECVLLSPEAMKILWLVSSWATKYQIPSYVRSKNRGVLRHLVLREGKNTGQRIVHLYSTSQVGHLEALAKALHEGGPPISTFLWTAHDDVSDAAVGEVRKIFWGEGTIEEKIEGLTFKVTPTSFMQTNIHAFEGLLKTLRRWVKEDRGAGEKSGTLVDLYCGSGAIGLQFSKMFKKVLGLEINAQSIADARENAVLNSIGNVEFVNGRAEEEIGRLTHGVKNAIAVIDPPRAGLSSSVLRHLLDWAPSPLYYISCCPASLARDLRGLTSKYRILEVQPMDFFPHTDHVETMVRMVNA